MAEPQPSAPPRAPSAVPGGGVVHVTARHTERFTVVGNHLAQHRELSLTAIGLGVHIQSLPDGARVDIRTLAARFAEGETRIAAALRELEAHGYLSRKRERLPSGRVVTRTVSYDNPAAVRAGQAERVRPSRPPVRLPEPRPTPAPAPAAEPTPVPAPVAAPPPPPPPPLPQPRTTGNPVRERAATAILAELRRDDPRLLLSERDVTRLAPAVTAWLERGAAPDAVRRTLAADLPAEPLRHPAALLAHRLTALLPPHLPAAPPPAPRPPRPDPLRNCDGCDRAFRSPAPGLCRDCREARATAPPPLAA
ncbi:helix-turn-helix domain-containing protein [Streptomyces verrucosisporus]|uniref:helix-turn-helix domain-containing protein n=1 Tax=Streptomyces verrucosisporus TaxID=1695161 RepID=UPI0019CFDF02|nr:helix-turn-helix domain-containing protein [Streptomyces verrucosisporus]MBN3930797.1 helix-turn-helix domain-containing protein [Streptomyces verrucosisporus]